MSTAGLSYRRPDVALLPSTSGSSSTQPQTSSSDGLLPSSTSSERMPDPAGSTDKGKGKATEVDFLHGLPALPPVSPLSSSPYFSQGFASFPSASEDLSSSASPLSMRPSPVRPAPPRLNLPPVHLDSFRPALSPTDSTSPTQLSYRRSPSPSSPQISPGLQNSEGAAGRAVVYDSTGQQLDQSADARLSPASNTPRPNGAFDPSPSSSSPDQKSTSPVENRSSLASVQAPLPLSATSDQFPLDPAYSRRSSSSHSQEQKMLARKGTVGLSLVKASNEARASASEGQKEVMRGLGFVQDDENAQTTTEPPDTANSGTFGPSPAVRRVSASSHPSSPPPAPSPTGPPPPVPTLPAKSTARSSQSPNPNTPRPPPHAPAFSPDDCRPSAASAQSSVTSSSAGPSSRKTGTSSTAIGGLSIPPLPLPPTFSNFPRSDSGVLDPRLMNGSLTASPSQEVLKDLERKVDKDDKPDGGDQVNFAGIGSRHHFSPLQTTGPELPSPVDASIPYDPTSSLGPTPSQRRALPRPPKSTTLPNHPPPAQPQGVSSPQQPTPRGSYPPLAQVASPPSTSKRLVDPSSRYQSGAQTGTVADDPYQAARRSLDPQTFQGMVGQVGQSAMGPEVCLECMMRDRDLIHVDVSSPGVWARHSDVDLQDLALREADGEDVTPYLRGGLTWEGGGPIGMGKVAGLRPPAERRISGDRLTETALKEWTLKSPPAATHRFQTLQKYLMGQLQLIAELGGPSAAALLANVSTEVESRVLKSKIQNTFAPLRRDEPVTLTQADAARMRPAKGRPGPDPDSMVEVENYNGKMSFDSKRSRRKSVGMDLRNGPSRLSVADGPNGISPQVREFPPSMPHAQGMRSTTMPMPLPSSASAINFPHARHPQDGGDFRSASAASYNPVAFPRGDPGPIPDGKPVRPFSFAMWAGRTRSSSNASQDGSRGGIFKGRFGMGSGRSEASDMTGGGGSAWGGSGSMMNMHVAMDQERDQTPGQHRSSSYASPYHQAASTDALNVRWRNDGDNLSYAASSQYYNGYPASQPTSPARQGAPRQTGGQDGAKKKKGFKAFFSKLGGTSVKSSSSFGNSPQLVNSPFGASPSQRYPSPGEEDFGPLAPPPSLSILSRRKTPSTSSLQSVASGPNSPRVLPAGQDHSRAPSISNSSIFSNPAMIAPALSSGQSFSSSQHPRSVSTPNQIQMGAGLPGLQYGKATPTSPSLAPTKNSMSPASGTFPLRRGSRDTIGSRQSMVVGGDVGDFGPASSPGVLRPRPSPGNSLAEEGVLPRNEYFPPGGDSYQRRSSASANVNPFSPVQPLAHRLSMASVLVPSFSQQPAPGHPSNFSHRRQSSSIQKDLPPLPPPSPDPATQASGFPPNSPFFSNSPAHAQGPMSNGRPMQQYGMPPAPNARSTGTDQSKKEKKRGKLSGFFGVGGKRDSSEHQPRSSSRNEGLIGYRYSSHESQ